MSCSLIPCNLYFKCSKAFKPRRISTFHDLQLYGNLKAVLISKLRDEASETPNLSCRAKYSWGFISCSFTSNICASSKSSQGYLALLSQQYSQQSCFVTSPEQISVSFGRSKRYRETKSSIIPLTLCFWPQGWHCYWRFHEIWSVESEPVQISGKRDTPTRQILL